MRIATHPEAIKHLVKIGMASDISEHIKMVESANESLIKEKDELRSVAEDNKRECEATRIENARLKAEVERLRIAGSESEPRFVLLSDYRHLKAERDALKAEVERLDTLCKQLMAQHSDISCDNIQLQARCDFLEGRNKE